MALGNTVKTWTLLAALAALLVTVGGLLGGGGGMILAFAFALALNGFAYWMSDSLALRANGARPLADGELPALRFLVARLAARAGLPLPRLYVVDRPEPNAFATGRDPRRAALAVTTGLIASLNERQLQGVVAHELSHIRNRDTLVGAIAATFASAVSFLAQMAQLQLLLGGGRGDGEGRNPIGLIGAMLLAPIAALVVQLAVSRNREYLADSSAAELTGDPEGLAQALEELEVARLRVRPRYREASAPGTASPAPSPAFAHLYIVNPLRGARIGSLFSTHPPIPERITRLRAMSPISLRR